MARMSYPDFVNHLCSNFKYEKVVLIFFLASKILEHLEPHYLINFFIKHLFWGGGVGGLIID